jgi:hypothetical protein
LPQLSSHGIRLERRHPGFWRPVASLIATGHPATGHPATGHPATLSLRLNALSLGCCGPPARCVSGPPFLKIASEAKITASYKVGIRARCVVKTARRKSSDFSMVLGDAHLLPTRMVPQHADGPRSHVSGAKWAVAPNSAREIPYKNDGICQPGTWNVHKLASAASLRRRLTPAGEKPS